MLAAQPNVCELHGDHHLDLRFVRFPARTLRDEPSIPEQISPSELRLLPLIEC